jgi:hypothetical protein
MSLVAILAIDGAVLSGLEGNLGRLSAVGTDGVVHLA